MPNSNKGPALPCPTRDTKDSAPNHAHEDATVRTFTDNDHCKPQSSSIKASATTNEDCSARSTNHHQAVDSATLSTPPYTSLRAMLRSDITRYKRLRVALDLFCAKSDPERLTYQGESPCWTSLKCECCANDCHCMPPTKIRASGWRVRDMDADVQVAVEAGKKLGERLKEKEARLEALERVVAFVEEIRLGE